MTFDREKLSAENWIQLFSQGCTEWFLFDFPVSVYFNIGGKNVYISKCILKKKKHPFFYQ